MLKVNVGISRKVSRDYNSTGFSINLEGEVTAPIDDAEGVIEQIRRLYDTADEALRDQIERHQSIPIITAENKLAPPRSSASPRRGLSGADAEALRFRGNGTHRVANGDEAGENGVTEAELQSKHVRR